MSVVLATSKRVLTRFFGTKEGRMNRREVQRVLRVLYRCAVEEANEDEEEKDTHERIDTNRRSTSRRGKNRIESKTESKTEGTKDIIEHVHASTTDKNRRIQRYVFDIGEDAMKEYKVERRVEGRRRIALPTYNWRV